MREFYGVEFVDGDIKVYGREQDLDNDPWQLAGTVKFGEPRQVEGVAERLGLHNMNGTELARLHDELVWPRRH